MGLSGPRGPPGLGIIGPKVSGGQPLTPNSHSRI